MQFDISDRQTGRTTRLAQQILFDVSAKLDRSNYPVVCAASKSATTELCKLLTRFKIRELVYVCIDSSDIFECIGCLPKNQIRLYVDDLECNKPFLQFLQELDLTILAHQVLISSGYFAATSSDAVTPLRVLGLEVTDLRVTSTVKMSPMGFI